MGLSLLRIGSDLLRTCADVVHVQEGARAGALAQRITRSGQQVGLGRRGGAPA
ncbi:hypothetical protein [Streptomyces sp. NPDC002078]